jgi:phage-related protein
MKTAEPKTAPSQQHQTASNSFFDRGQESAFFADRSVDRTSFFPATDPKSIQAKSLPGHKPFFAHPPATTIQAKCATCATQEKAESEPAQAESPQIQMMPAFESAADGDDGAEQPFVQFSLKVGQPGDAYEREADAMADRVVSMPRSMASDLTPKTLGIPQPQQVNRKQTMGMRSLMRQTADSTPAPTPKNLESRLQQSQGSGSPLDPNTRTEMEGSFAADFSGVQIHTGQESASLNKSLGARAFTHGNDIFFNSGEYQPQSSQGKHLLSHELTHTLQQGASVQRKPAVSSTSHEVQMLPGSLLSALADYARYIPGYTLFTVVLGFNPLTGNRVVRNASTLLEGLMGLVPFGTFIFDKLHEHGILQSAFKWVEGELGRLDLSVARIERTLEAAWEDIHIVEGFDYNLQVLERHFGQLLNDVKSFARSLVDHIIQLIKDTAINLAEGLLADNKAWALIKKILQYDPLKGEPVNATIEEILEDFLRLIGKEAELEQMREKGTLKETAAWIKTQIGTFLSLLGELKGLFTAAWDAIQPQNLPNLATNLRNLVTQTTGFLKRVWTFAVTVAAKVLELIKKVLLGLLSQHASKTPGYFLLTVILGKDIFTQQVVPRTVTNIIKGFITLLPNGEQQYKQMEETGVIARAAGRIEALMSQLGISWAFVRDLFLGIWNKLTIESLIQPIATFIQIVSQFKEPIVRLISFTIEVIKIVLDLVLQLMNFPPGIVGRIINNAMQAFNDIKKNPVGFLLNLLKAVKTGFLKFFDNILKHLLTGVSDWLFGQLGKAGIEVPKDFTLPSILKLVFQVLDITMDKMWKKLADRIGQPTVDKIRGAIDKLVGVWNFVKDVQQRGMAAVWEYIQGQISNLWDMVLGFVRDWIMKKIVEKVVINLLSMLDPTGIMAVVNSFIAFFNAVQSAIEYFRQILEIVDSFVGTVAEIASGSVDRAAQFLENLLARSLPVAIGFLANQVGLGSVGDKIQEIIAGVRGVVDKALDWLIDQAVKLGKAALNVLGLGKKDESPEGKDKSSQGTVKEPFSMGSASHTLTAMLKEDTVIITMASMDDDTRVSMQLQSAINLIHENGEVDDKGQQFTRDKTQKDVILITLRAVKAQVDEIRPPKGAEGVKFETFIKPKLAKCIGQLSSLAKYKPAITSLKPLIAMGQPRYIPKGFDIRSKLYDATTGGQWKNLSKTMRDNHVAKLDPQLFKIWKLRDDPSSPGNYANAKAEWDKMQSNREIPSSSNAPTFASYDHLQHFNRSKPFKFTYETDHDPSLGTSWNNGEKNKDDNARKQTTLNQGNLRVITWEENNERSHKEAVNPKFFRDVEPDFSSDVAHSPKGSMTIDGKPFDDKPS